MELTNSIRKMVASLGSAKCRREEGCFVVEGTKCVLDTLAFFSCRYLLATAQWVETNNAFIGDRNIIVVKRADIERMSQLNTPTPVIAVYDLPQKTFSDSIFDNLVIALDRVQDPGNLGTIIRIADWFGITDIVCSHDTVDVYNPKVIQATMGAISRVNVHYVDLVKVLSEVAQTRSVYGTFLDGDNIYEKALSQTGVVVMGNEGSGISSEIADIVNSKLYIPSYPIDRPTSESLNVGMATAITIAEFRRRIK